MAGSTIWAPVGEKGPDGDPGPQGPPGDPGPQGPPGPGTESFVVTATTVANLRTLSKLSYTMIQTKGYWAQGDSGGNLYYLDAADTTSVENGCTVIVGADGGRWKPVTTAYMTAKQAGLRGDGVTSDNARGLAFAAADISHKHFSAGTYIGTSVWNFGTNAKVTGDTDKSMLDFSSAVAIGAHCVTSIGSITALPALTAAVANKSNTLVFASAPDLKIGDIVLIWNPTDASWSTWRPDYRAGEYCRVASVSGNTVTLFGLTYDAYASSAVQLYKLGGTTACFKDIKIKQPASANDALFVSWADNPIIDNVPTEGSLYAGITVQNCVDITCRVRAKQASAPSGNNYGMVVSNCQGGVVEGYLYATRHPNTMGGNVGIGSVPCRNIDIYASMSNLLAGIGAGDLHGNTEDIRFHGQTFNSGGVVAGKNNRWIGCKFIGPADSGVALYMGEVKEGLFKFIGCTFEGDKDPNSAGNGDGLLTFQNFNANVIGDCNFVFDNPTIHAPVATVYPMLFALNGTSATININFEGNVLFTRSPAMTQMLRLRQYGTTGTFGNICMPSVSGMAASGIPYAVLVGAPPVQKFKLPDQVGTTTVSTVTSTSLVAAPAVVFPHAYPTGVTPWIEVHTGDVNVGGKRVTTGFTSPSNSGMTPQLATTDVANFSSVATTTLYWQTKLNQH